MGYLQDYYYKPIRASAVLTNSYVPATVMGLDGDPEPSQRNQFQIYADVTLGSLDSVEIIVEFSHDQTTWYQETSSAVSSGTVTESLAVHTIVADGNYRISVPIKDEYIKVSAKGTGTVTDSLLSMAAIIGNV